MTLTNRFSFFFLAALAVVLIGFSTTLLIFTERHLQSQADFRLQTAMQTLVAAIEIFPDYVEWEPNLRHISLGDDSGADQVRWIAVEKEGNLIDCSRNLQQIGSDGSLLPPSPSGWRLMVHSLEAGKIGGTPPSGATAIAVVSHPDGFPTDRPLFVPVLPQDRQFVGPQLKFTVASSEEPIRAILRRLAWAMTWVSLVIWLFAAVVGRWFCRRALRPVSRMAISAREIKKQPDSQFSLDVASTGDEFEDLGHAFNELLVSIKESAERQRKFTGDASHQLRTPLAALRASVEVTLRQERPTADYQRVLGVVLKRSDQLQQIIESLLFLARSGTDLVLPDPIDIDLAKWSKEWFAGWEVHERASDISLRCPSERFQVLTNPGLLAQLLDDLLDNACKYSLPGTPIAVDIEGKGREVCVSVEDKGAGISEADLPHIFEPFYRSESARTAGKPGTGLGLALVKRLASILGGSISVTSKAGSGSRFLLTLPAERCRESEPPPSSSSRASVGGKR